MLTCRTIVVALDFSPASQAALRLATELASDLPQCRLHLLHIVDEPICEAWTVKAPDAPGTTLRKLWLEQAQQHLDEIAIDLPLETSRLSCAAIVGSPYREITRYATSHHADLLIVGSHGYGFVKRTMMGSVAGYVRDHATCPVLVVPVPQPPLVQTARRVAPEPPRVAPR